MAVATSGFMAGTGLVGTNLDILDCSDILAAILMKDTSFLKQVKVGKPVKNIEHSWIEDRLNTQSFMGIPGTGSVTMYIEDANISSTAEFLKVCRTDSIVVPEGWEDIHFKMGAPDKNSVAMTISRWSSIDSWSASITTGLCWPSTTVRYHVVASPYEDQKSASSDTSRVRTRRKNYTQIFERAVEINETRKHIELYAVGDEDKMQIRNRTMEIKRELNASAINGHAYVTAGAGSADVANATMHGLIAFLRDPDIDSTTEDYQVIDKAGVALTMSAINDLTAQMYDAGGFGDDADPFILVSPYQARIIALLEENRIRRSSKELVVGSYANKVKTDLGFDLDVIVDRYIPRQYLAVVDRSNIEIRPLQGDAWHLEKMAKTGRSEKFQLSGQYTMEVRNADCCHGLLRGLSYTANLTADY